MKQYVFWKYDLYPFVVWAEVDKIEDGRIYLKGWQGSYRTFKTIIALLGEKEGESLIIDLTYMKDNYNNYIKKQNKKAKDLIKRISK